MIIKLQITLKKLIENGVIYIWKHLIINKCSFNKQKTSFILLSFKNLKNLQEKYFWIHPSVKILHLLCLNLLEKHSLKKASSIGLRRFLSKAFKIASLSILLITRNRYFGSSMITCKICIWTTRVSKTSYKLCYKRKRIKKVNSLTQLHLLHLRS